MGRQGLLVLVVLLPFAAVIARDEPRLAAFGISRLGWVMRRSTPLRDP
jgi:hypothetical protein